MRMEVGVEVVDRVGVTRPFCDEDLIARVEAVCLVIWKDILITARKE